MPRLLMCLLAAAVLAGCAGSNLRGSDLSIAHPRDGGAPLPEPMQTLFDASAPRQAALATSPWGSDVTLVLHELYPAASGRDCRSFLIRSEDESQPGLACRRANDTWAEVRVLHHQGRPVMEDAR